MAAPVPEVLEHIGTWTVILGLAAPAARTRPA